MKKIFVIMLCVIMIAVVPVAVFADEAVTEPPAETENVTEAEKPITEIIVDYIKENIEEISVISGLIFAFVYKIYDRRRLSGTIGTLNNNAITVAENSAKAIKNALTGVEDVSKVVNEYRDKFEAVLKEIRKSAEDQKNLEDTLKGVETFLKTAKGATLELSNEVAELLVLANIPNSKKDELYARHTKVVHELEEAEGVINNDGKKA